MADPKFVIAITPGAEFTPKNERVDICGEKAYAFGEVWDDFIKGRPIVKPKQIVSTIAWDDLYENLFETTNVNQYRVEMLKYLEQNNVDLLRCDEKDLREAMVKQITSDKNINKETSVDKLCSYARCAFRAIGREHSWIDGQIIEMFNKPFVDTRNPVTKSTTTLLKNIINKKTKGSSKTKDKFGGAASIATIYYMITNLLKQAITETRFDRKENCCYLGLLLSFLMHEGCRPGEIHNRVRHKDLYFALHKKVYWLTLVFLSDECLNHIIENYLIQSYVYILYKGKRMNAYQGRVKTSIPILYNSLDLPILYTIFIKLSIRSEIREHVFKTMNYADLLADKLDRMKISRFVFYSIRYGTCEEDKKYKIPGEWTKYLAGHSDNSLQGDKYAKNQADRVIYDTHICPLGIDIYPNSPTSNDISLEMMPTQGYDIYSNKHIIADKKYEMEFELISNHVAKFLETNDEESLEFLMSRHKNDISGLQIGFGNFTFPDNMFPDKMKELYETNIQYLRDTFKTPERPDHFYKPELWSWLQVRYGDWSQLFTKSATKLNMKTSFKETVHAKRNLKDITQEGEWDWICDNITVGNYVVIICRQPDKYSMSLPNIDDAKVWIAHVTRFKKMSSTIYANFLYNKDNDVTKPLNLFTKDKVSVSNDVIMGIFEDDEDFALDSKDVEEIEKYVTLYHKMQKTKNKKVTR